MYDQEVFGWAALGQGPIAVLSGDLCLKAAWSCCPGLDRIAYAMVIEHSL